MSTLPSTAAVRDLIQRTFEDFGIDGSEPPRETLLIRDGHFCGRRFCHESMDAIWFVEENEIKFYDSTGAVVRVIAPITGDDNALDHVA